MKYNNIIFLGLCLGLTTYSALSADSVIKISGRVLDYGCTVSSDSLNFTVDLQKNSARQFPTTGSTSPAVPFQITLSECSKGTTGVRVAFNGRQVKFLPSVVMSMAGQVLELVQPLFMLISTL